MKCFDFLPKSTFSALMMGIWVFFFKILKFYNLLPVMCTEILKTRCLFRNERLVLVAGLLPEESRLLSSLSQGNQNTRPGACLLPGRTGSGYQHPMLIERRQGVRILDFHCCSLDSIHEWGTEIQPVLWPKIERENQQELTFGDLPGGPVVKTLCFQCRGSGFNPWSAN